jgi:hypothetical protein
MRLALLLLFAGGLSASTLLVTADGTFSGTTPTTSFSVAGESWSLSFEVNSNPVVLSSEAGVDFSPSFTDFTYTLDGSPVAITPADIQFYSGGHYGLMNVCFAPACGNNTNPTNGIEIEGLQAYSGPESSPTIDTGVYTTASLGAYVGSSDYGMSNSTVTISTVPEPGYLGLVTVVGMLACMAVRRAGRRQ